MKRAYIVCTGSSLGEKRIETEALLRNAGLEKLGVQADVILTELGVKSVYRSSIETKPSELAIEAAVKALQKFPGSPHDIGFLAFCGIERDSTEPATAHKI
jgi:3-oxoacyl-[acyl-carrier-protein] synthase III